MSPFEQIIIHWLFATIMMLAARWAFVRFDELQDMEDTRSQSICMGIFCLLLWIASASSFLSGCRIWFGVN